MRGKLCVTPRIGSNSGITPACAGKTRRSRVDEAIHEDHPRVCGENPRLCARIFEPEGSPPRVRGKPRYCSRLSFKLRITPACAGKTHSPPRKALARKDHPRVCGENHTKGGHRNEKIGSPPRVRGKQPFEQCVANEVRITPACAGKTPKRSISLNVTGDHPRVCGENLCLHLRDFHTRGSPPRVRGKLAHHNAF